jgi:cytochrome c oxidase assembly protein subunit 17
MGAGQSRAEQQQSGQWSNGNEQPNKKICCACPETKNARDSCIAERGEERCGYLVEAHKRCLRDEGFRV